MKGGTRMCVFYRNLFVFFKKGMIFTNQYIRYFWIMFEIDEVFRIWEGDVTSVRCLQKRYFDRPITGY